MLLLHWQLNQLLVAPGMGVDAVCGAGLRLFQVVRHCLPCSCAERDVSVSCAGPNCVDDQSPAPGQVPAHQLAEGFNPGGVSQ